MPLTWTGAVEAFKHILSNVLEAPEDGPLAKALQSAGYDDVWSLVTMSDADIDSLTFDRSEKEKNIPLGRAHQALLHIFCHYHDHQAHIGSPVGDDWTAITADDFNDYHIGPDYSAIHNGAVIPPPALPPNQWGTYPLQLTISSMVSSVTHPYLWYSRMANSLTHGSVPL